MYQKLIVAGNLGSDVELRFLPNGTPVGNFSLATNNVYTNKSGEKVQETTWFRVSVFGKQAETCAKYLAKGRKVLIEGQLRPDPATGSPRLFTASTGEARASYDVIAQVVRFLSDGGAKGEADGATEEPPEVVSDW